MQESTNVLVRFKVAEVKGSMDYGAGHVVLHPDNLYITMQIEGVVVEDGNVEITASELNLLVARTRTLAHANILQESDY